MDVGTMAQWAGACATTLAVVVALLKDEIIGLWRHPKLVASIKAEHPYCVRTPNGETVAGAPRWNGWRYFLRIDVRNEGNLRAEKVEVFLSRAWEQDSRGSLKPLMNFTPMNLRWSYSDYDHPDIYADGISPEMGKLCDLAAISDPKTPSLQPLGAPQVRLSLRLEGLPLNIDWLLPGKYEFEVKLVGSNCKPTAQRIQLHLTGIWHDEPADMLAHGIRFDLP